MPIPVVISAAPQTPAYDLCFVPRLVRAGPNFINVAVVSSFNAALVLASVGRCL